MFAALSLLWHATPGFDPWVWLVWGREVVGLELDTTAGAVWKPLPVLVTTLLALAGEAAPELWLVVARTGGLLAVVLTFRLAARLAGPWAGVGAASALVVTPGIEARFARLVIQGSIEPLVVALCLGAVERHLDGHEGPALALGVAASLARPEAWPLLALYAVWLWRRRPHLRWLVAVGLGVVPLLWLGGDWLGAGDPVAGADRAQVLRSRSPRLERARFRISRAVIPPVWVGAAWATVAAWRRGGRMVPVLAGGALAWLAVVAAMTVGFGYAALGRFLLPASAVLSVLAAVGAVRAVTALRDRRLRAGVAVGLLTVTVAFAVQPVRAGLSEAALAIRRGALDRQLDVAIARAGGADAVTACGPVAIEREGVALSSWPGLAWKLGLPVAGVEGDLPGSRGVVIALAGGPRERRLDAAGPEVRRLGGSAGWTVFGVGCPRAASGVARRRVD